MERFTVFEIIRQAPRLVFGRFGAVLASALIPALAMTGVQILGQSRLVEGLDFAWRRLFVGVAEWIMAAPFLAAWYRHFLDPTQPAPSFVARLGRGGLPFVLYTAGFVFVLLSSFVAANTVFGNLGPEAIRIRLPLSQVPGSSGVSLRASLLEVAALVLVFAVYLRLIFVFPASAAGEPLGLDGSWRISRNHHLKILLVLVFMAMLFALIGVFVMPLILSMVIAVLGPPGIAAMGFGNASLMLTLFLTNIFILVSTAAQAAAVALMYKALTAPVAGNIWQNGGEET